jgi:hypothetical protein
MVSAFGICLETGQCLSGNVRNSPVLVGDWNLGNEKFSKVVDREGMIDTLMTAFWIDFAKASGCAAHPHLSCAVAQNE